MTDEDGFCIEAAEQYGFEAIGADEGDEMECYKCTESQLIAFAKACERAGMARVTEKIERTIVEEFDTQICAIDNELQPILESVRALRAGRAT